MAGLQTEADPPRYFGHIGEERGAVAEAEPVYLETPNRCSLLRTTCPRAFNALGPPADMTWALLTGTVNQLLRIARVELHRVGEPMMMRYFPRMIRYLKDCGWNLEMRIRAARAGLRILEVPVAHRRRASGVSKVSGSLGGTPKASWPILLTCARVALERRRPPPAAAPARRLAR